MNSQEVLQSVAQRLTTVRRANFACSLAAPFLAAIIFIVISRYYSLHITTLAALLAVVMALFAVVLRRTWRWINETSTLDAARLLDQKLSAKERFLTVASLSLASAEEASSLKLVNAQATQLVTSFDTNAALPFTLEPSAKYSVMATPPLLVLLAVLLWFSPTSRSGSIPEIAALSKETANDIRELINHSPNLSPQWKESMHDLAELIEDQGLLSDEVEQNVDELLSRVDNFTPPINQDIEESAPPSPPPPPPKPEESTEEPKHELETPTTSDERPSEASEQQQEQAQSSSSTTSTANQPPSDPSKSKDAPKDKSQEGSPESSRKEGQGEKQQGAQGQQGATPDDSGSESKQQEQQQGGKAPEENEKKDVSGLGEGQGSGGGESKKDLQGEGKKGGSEEGAKDGQAKNDAPGTTAGTADNTDKKEGSGSKPNATKQPATQNGGGKEDKQESSAPGDSAEEQAKAMSEKVNSLKEKLKEQTAQSSPSESQPSGTQGGAAEQANQDPRKAQSQKAGKGNKESTPQSKQNGTQDGERQQPSPGDKDKGTSNDPSKTGDNKKQQENNDQNSQKHQQREEENSNRDSAGGLDRSINKAEPSEQAQRFGPFAGGNGGKIETSDAERTKVGIPLEEKLVVHSLGGSDNKLYKNKPGASAQTKLGTGEFKKPEAEIGELSQPIPVEYQDLIHSP